MQTAIRGTLKLALKQDHFPTLTTPTTFSSKHNFYPTTSTQYTSPSKHNPYPATPTPPSSVVKQNLYPATPIPPTNSPTMPQPIQNVLPFSPAYTPPTTPLNPPFQTYPNVQYPGPPNFFNWGQLNPYLQQQHTSIPNMYNTASNMPQIAGHWGYQILIV